MNSNDSNKIDQVRSPVSGTRTIPRNRRGPMSRAMLNMSPDESISAINERQRALRRHRHEKSQRGRVFTHQNLTTHMDDDDTEILIESALGNYEGGLKETFATKARRFGFRRRDYAPLRGYDILSEEERNCFQIPSPESIFEVPPCLKDPQNRLRLYKTIMILLGVSIYFLSVTIVKGLYHHSSTTGMKSSFKGIVSKPVETNVNIKNMTAKNVFKENIDHKKVEQDKTMDIGYNGEDDMIVEVKKNSEKLESTTLEDLHDDYVSTEDSESTNSTETTSLVNKNETMQSVAVVNGTSSIIHHL